MNVSLSIRDRSRDPCGIGRLGASYQDWGWEVLLQHRPSKGSAVGPLLGGDTVEAVRQQGTPSPHVWAMRATLMVDLSSHGFYWEKAAFGMSTV